MTTCSYCLGDPCDCAALDPRPSMVDIEYVINVDGKASTVPGRVRSEDVDRVIASGARIGLTVRRRAHGTQS